jgi:hypothetical protein
MPISMKEQQIIIFFHNELNAEMFEGNDISVFGTMVTVLGTSSKQRSIEVFFMNQLGVIGLEMEGSYYQKAIQSASKIRKVFP